MNDLVPGTALTELALATRLTSSQGAIREALLRLEGEGLVSRNGRQGTIVTALDRETAEEILDLRRRIECRGAQLAARRCGAGDIAGLSRLFEQMHRHADAGDAWALIEADTAFHLTLFRLSGLLALEPILARCVLHTHRFRLWAPWHRRPLHQTAARHAAIMAALEMGSPTALSEAITTHLDTIVETETMGSNRAA